jgi:hypothetical protein
MTKSYHNLWITVRDLFHLPNLMHNALQPFTESDDTRCCDNTICPPEDGHVDARNI